MKKIIRREEKKDKRRNEEEEEDVGFLFNPQQLRAQRFGEDCNIYYIYRENSLGTGLDFN